MHGEPEIKVELALFRTCRLPPQHIYEQIVCKNLVSLYFDHLEHRGKKFINHERIEMIAFFSKVHDDFSSLPLLKSSRFPHEK